MFRWLFRKIFDRPTTFKLEQYLSKFFSQIALPIIALIEIVTTVVIGKTGHWDELEHTQSRNFMILCALTLWRLFNCDVLLDQIEQEYGIQNKILNKHKENNAISEKMIYWERLVDILTILGIIFFTASILFTRTSSGPHADQEREIFNGQTHTISFEYWWQPLIVYISPLLFGIVFFINKWREEKLTSIFNCAVEKTGVIKGGLLFDVDMETLDKRLTQRTKTASEEINLFTRMPSIPPKVLCSRRSFSHRESCSHSEHEEIQDSSLLSYLTPKIFEPNEVFTSESEKEIDHSCDQKTSFFSRNTAQEVEQNDEKQQDHQSLPGSVITLIEV